MGAYIRRAYIRRFTVEDHFFQEMKYNSADLETTAAEATEEENVAI